MEDFYRELSEELEKLKAQAIYREFRTVENSASQWVVAGGGELLNLCSNNYLGIANHPLLKDASVDAINRYGSGATSSRLIIGNYDLYEEAEREIARFKNTESALLFNSGYVANIGTIAAIIGRGDLVLSDKLNHASIIDGILISRADHIRYRHCDLTNLENHLKHASYKRKMIITDSVFSMDGDLAPLPGLVELKEKYGAILMIDEAHGSGVFGANGRGLAEYYGVSERIDINMGTLGKAFGCAGAYVAGKKVLIDYLKNKARSLIFTTGLPPSTVASINAALKVVRDEGWRRDSVLSKAKLMRDRLGRAGFNTLNSQSQIIPLVIGYDRAALEFSRRLYEENILAPAIRYPAVPKKMARIRLSIMATHQLDDLEWALERIERIGRETGVIG
ncbi:MAG: 8-amino-7-oxononanoate synthase, partial [Actinobacteria bacterium]|nr:8-amino-7-oxononanoate synthase [Actinomycetota bacterium]